MLKISDFFFIFVMMMIANRVIAENEFCAEDLLDDIDDKYCGELDGSKSFGEAQMLEEIRCPYKHLELIGEDGEYIEPRTPNEAALITHGKALEDCVRSLPEKTVVVTDKSYYSCMDKADDELKEAYDCSS